MMFVTGPSLQFYLLTVKRVFESSLPLHSLIREQLQNSTKKIILTPSPTTVYIVSTQGLLTNKYSYAPHPPNFLLFPYPNLPLLYYHVYEYTP